ncbi:hypothetical protein DFH08DRAFT_831749 [Mycena albidolilacea]|uniref:F-box domain-containing protein n=1 Tax=Mycena albidolilacea TaxID=1033008 RepID=A0AAD7AVH6_9AGAR|nr:hypothetical protein DFH08DRAFT_831749 [Mycena albidolilacea]
MRPHLLLPQELVDECLGQLSAIDLKACALVCRSWSHSAQRALFKDVFVVVPEDNVNASGGNLSNRLEETLRTSPHLIRHIRSLRLRREGEMDLEPFQRVCNIPFTHLEDLYINYWRVLAPQSEVALQQLLSLSTLRRVHLECTFDSTFTSIWDRCSLNIRHVSVTNLTYNFPSSPRRAQPYSGARIVLESLQLRGIGGYFVWLERDVCPLDFSRLVVLSVTDASVLRWSRMAPAFQTIQALDVPHSKALDLSLFPNCCFSASNLTTSSRQSILSKLLRPLPASSRLYFPTSAVIHNYLVNSTPSWRIFPWGIYPE